MNPVKTMTGVVTRPVHTAASVAGRAIGLSLGVTKAGVRTTGRIVEWAADRGLSAPEATSVPHARRAPETTYAPEAARASGPAVPSAVADQDTEVSGPTPEPSSSSVPTPADVKPAIDRSAPLEAETPEIAEPEAEDDLRTASGIPAAGVGVNPATGEPNAYDTEPEPLLDPATVKAVRSETDVLRRAAGDEPARKRARKTSKKASTKASKDTSEEG